MAALIASSKLFFSSGVAFAQADADAGAEHAAGDRRTDDDVVLEFGLIAACR